jgi:hypothetical protein
VALSRAGLYLIDSKTLDGRLVVRDGVLIQERGDESIDHYRADDLPGAMVGAAKALTRDLKRASRVELDARPVVAIWGDFPQRKVDCQTLTYVHGDALFDWLAHQPALLSPWVFDQLRQALDSVPTMIEQLRIDAEQEYSSRHTGTLVGEA